MLAAVTGAALIPVTGASAKTPPPAITAITGSSTGTVGSFCEFGVVVTYSPRQSPHALRTEKLIWGIRKATDNSSVGDIVPVTLGPSPFTPSGLAFLEGTGGALPAGSYSFDVQVFANGSAVSEQHTGTFTLNGMPAPAGCPAMGQLATFP
jgi:hypothetical protein